MPNLYAEFRRLVPTSPLQVGTVTAYAAGVATVQLPGGSTLQARGQATIGQTIYVRDSLIEGPAPQLPIEPIEL